MRRQYFFPPADLPGGKPACPEGKQVLKNRWYSKEAYFNSTWNYLIDITNRIAIDVFFAAQVARQKGLRPSAFVCG